jgi:Zn-dependent protease with chaperone function
MASTPEGMTEAQGVVGTLGEQDCPTCGARIVYDRGFVPWCDSCDWNVDVGSTSKRGSSRVDALKGRVTRRAGESLYGELVGMPVGKPRLTISRLVAYAISLPILVISLLILVGGALLIVTGSNLIQQALGVIVVLVAVAGRPRFVKAPERRLTSAEAPELIGLIEEIARTLHAPMPAVIGVEGVWNAMTSRVGWRQRHVIVIGLPLWLALDDRARVFVLGHEVAHAVNGDTTRSVIVGTALETLCYWAYLLEPDDLTSGDPGLLGIAMIPVNMVFYALAASLRGIAAFLVMLLLRDSQRAELYADRLAASVAGTDAAIAGLEGLRREPAFDRALGALATGRRRPTELFDELARQVAITPSAEWERLRRQERAAGLNLIGTHPPLYLRVAVLRANPSLAPRIELTPERSARIDAELAAHRDPLASEAVEGYLDAIS